MRRKRKNGRAITAKEATIAANAHVLFHYPTMFTGAGTHHLILAGVDLWIVPIVLTHPDYGILGIVGLIAVNASTGQVIGGTPREEVVAAGKRLREGKGYDVRATVLPSRAV